MLRAAQMDDAPRIAELHIASWRATYTTELPQAFLDCQDIEERTAYWRGRLAGGVIVLLAEGQDGLDGFVACGPAHGGPTDGPDSVEWEIYNLHVAPTRNGGGIGSRLFNAAEELGRDRGGRQLILWVVRTNATARTFYEAKGMRADGGEQQHVLGDEVLHEMRYRKDLGAANI